MKARPMKLTSRQMRDVNRLETTKQIGHIPKNMSVKIANNELNISGVMGNVSMDATEIIRELTPVMKGARAADLNIGQEAAYREEYDASGNVASRTWTVKSETGFNKE